MRKPSALIAPTVFFALLALIVVGLPTGSAHAAADCLAAPNKPSPQGSHWYYRLERATKRKCWYLGPEGKLVRREEPQSRAADTPFEPTEEQPSASVPPTTAGGPAEQAGAPVSAARARQSYASATTLWPDPPAPSAIKERIDAMASVFPTPTRVVQEPQDPITQEQAIPETSGTTIRYAAAPPVQRQVPPAPAAADMTGLTPMRILLLVLLAGAAILSGAIFKIAGAWRRRPYVHRHALDWRTDAGQNPEPKLHTGDVARNGARPPQGQINFQHAVEDALRQLLRSRAELEQQPRASAMVARSR